jgi:hypothetical protein
LSASSPLSASSSPCESDERNSETDARDDVKSGW